LLDPDDELLLEFNEEFELEEEELDDEEESDEPDPEGELGQAGLLVLIYENWLRTVAGLETLS